MIKVVDLAFAYTNIDKALKGVSFSIEKGEWVSIIGHNGSGKSTLSKLLNGLLIPDKGQIYINNTLLNEDSVNDLRKMIGIVFQNPDNQFVGVSVKHDIAFGLENKCVERTEMQKLITEYANKVEMEKFLEFEPYKLSGGQKQRVAIAGVLAMNPEIIIFDEATSMLDPEGNQEITDLIKNIKREKTIITITHDLEFARLSDRIIVLNEGLIIADDKPEKIFKKTEMLINAKLDIPFNLKLYNEIINHPQLNQNERLKKAVWELNLGK